MKKLLNIFALFAVFFVIPANSMEFEYSQTVGSDKELLEKQKEETRQWLLTRIAPINPGYEKIKARRTNCTLVAKECVKVLAGLKEPERVPAIHENIDVLGRTHNKSGDLVSFEAECADEDTFIPHQEFVDTIDLVTDTTSIDLVAEFAPSMKYVTSNRIDIINDIKNFARAADGDQTLAGLLYYPSETKKAGAIVGHTANFFRDSKGNVFFVDAQKQTVTDQPPIKILTRNLTNRIFFFPLRPKQGFKIKLETPDVSIIKIERQSESAKAKHIRDEEDKSTNKRIKTEKTLKSREDLFEEFKNKTTIPRKELLDKNSAPINDKKIKYICPLCPETFVEEFMEWEQYKFAGHMWYTHNKFVEFEKNCIICGKVGSSNQDCPQPDKHFLDWQLQLKQLSIREDGFLQEDWTTIIRPTDFNRVNTQQSSAMQNITPMSETSDESEFEEETELINSEDWAKTLYAQSLKTTKPKNIVLGSPRKKRHSQSQFVEDAKKVIGQFNTEPNKKDSDANLLYFAALATNSAKNQSSKEAKFSVSYNISPIQHSEIQDIGMRSKDPKIQQDFRERKINTKTMSLMRDAISDSIKNREYDAFKDNERPIQYIYKKTEFNPLLYLCTNCDHIAFDKISDFKKHMTSHNVTLDIKQSEVVSAIKILLK